MFVIVGHFHPSLIFAIKSRTLQWTSVSGSTLVSSRGEGKTTYAFSANANVLSANFPFSMLPAGGEGVGTLVR